MKLFYSVFRRVRLLLRYKEYPLNVKIAELISGSMQRDKYLFICLLFQNVLNLSGIFEFLGINIIGYEIIFSVM